jgi:hypothetical protein
MVSNLYQVIQAYIQSMYSLPHDIPLKGQIDSTIEAIGRRLNHACLTYDDVQSCLLMVGSANDSHEA